MLLAWCVAAMAAATPTLRVETPGDGRPHRVSVIGVAEGALLRLRAGAGVPLAGVLAVFTEDAVVRPGLPAIAGTTEVDAEGVHFSPRFPFVAGMTYTARFELEGQRLERRFDVRAPAVEPPRVVTVYPSSGRLPENALRLYVHFSRPMSAKGSARHVRLLDGAGRPVPLAFVEVENGLWDPAQTRLTLFLHPGRVKRGVAPGERLGPVLRAGQRYRLVVDAALTDASGMPLGAAYEHGFDVTPADRARPRAGDVRVEESAPGTVALRLPEPLDHALMQRWIWVQDEQGRRVDGVVTVSEDETRWSFAPTGGWPAGRSAVCLEHGLEDRAGNRFDRAFDREPGVARPAAAAPPLCLPIAAR